MSKPSVSVEGESLVSNGIVVSLEYIGEGREGDHRPEDPTDARMLRLDVFPDRVDNEPHDGVSVRTMIEAEAPVLVRQAFMEHVAAKVAVLLADDPEAWIERDVAAMAWLTKEDFEHGVFVGGDEILDTHGDLGVGKVVDEYVNRSDDPLGVATYVCAFGEGDDVTHADRLAGEFTSDRAAIAAAKLGGASPRP